jgi:hypothetical protein
VLRPEALVVQEAQLVSAPRRHRCLLRGITLIAALRQHREVELAPGRIGVGFELDRRLAPLAAIERGVFDPLAQQAIAPQLASDAQAEPAGPGVVESRRLAAGAAVPVNETELVRTHGPRLFDDGGHRRPDKVAGPIAVQVDLGDARLCGVPGHAAFSVLRVNARQLTKRGIARRLSAIACTASRSW